MLPIITLDNGFLLLPIKFIGNTIKIVTYYNFIIILKTLFKFKNIGNERVCWSREGELALLNFFV